MANNMTHDRTAVTARLFDPEENNVNTMSVLAGTWATRTFDYLLDADGTWELTMEYGQQTFDYTIRITVVDPVSSTSMTYEFDHRIGTGGWGSRTYYIDVPTDAAWYFGPNQTVQAKEGTWINVTVQTLSYSNSNDDAYFAIVDSTGAFADYLGHWDVGAITTYTIQAMADINGSWLVDVWTVGAYWRYNLTVEVTDPTTGLSTSYWHIGMAGSWTQEGSHKYYHLEVPTNNSFHQRYDTV
ncbi:MAG: hypothetical protein KAQ96_08035, partial [Thermoplasmata archaeon]|nr:hypothetical protein [Thermoplasmata archaeon]